MELRMTVSDVADIAQAVAAVLTFGAAALAVWATIKAPMLAAKFAEDLRQSAQKNEEERRMKMWVFTSLIQNRATIAAPASVQALNAIDVVFTNETEVRQAWKHFLEAAKRMPFDQSALIERHRALIEKMARTLGLSGSITVQDIQDGYYPELLNNLDRAVVLEALEKLERLSPAAQAAPDPSKRGGAI